MLQKEMDFQLSGEVSDESAQSIGKKLGAQTIISGSLSPLGNMWRMRIKALEVETARIQGAMTYTVRKDAVISNLLPKLPKTVGEKIGSGALNLFFGLGSYFDGDIAGGLTITSGYVLATGLFVIEATALDWDSPIVGVPATIGVVAVGVTVVYGFIRPFIYNRSPKIAFAMDNIQVNIVPTSDTGYLNRNEFGVKLTYVLKY
jgi:hypothetical protein